MEKKIPNPNGKKGNEDHQNFIIELFIKLSKKYKLADTEVSINIDNKKKRFVDVAGLDEEGNPVELHQVGRTNKDGSPVIRERRAITDIEKATKLKVIFHALMLILVVTIGFWIYQNL